MPLATKNNAIIVKDGKLAENCDCCGGWYCCSGYPYWSYGGLSGCDPKEYISVVSVTIETGEDFSSKRSGYTSCSASFSRVYDKQFFIIPTSHYAGTFELSKSGPSGRFLYEYEPDEAGGVATIATAINFTGDGRLSWNVVLMGHCYQWSKYSRSEITDSKSLSDMKLVLTSTGSSSDCYASGYEFYNAGTPSISVGGVTSLCQSAFSFSGSTASRFWGCAPGSKSSDEKSGIGGIGGDFFGELEETGDSRVRISVEAS
jgi:hypothetical protein